MGAFTCTKCKRLLPTTEFPAHVTKQWNDGRTTKWCRACRRPVFQRDNAKRKLQRQAHDKKRSALGLKAASYLATKLAAFGLTMEAYDLMMVRQAGACGICSTPLCLVKRICLDHDHATNKVRGLLCSRCNLGLGYFQDSPALFDTAKAYVTNGGMPW